MLVIAAGGFAVLALAATLRAAALRGWAESIPIIASEVDRHGPTSSEPQGTCFARESGQIEAWNTVGALNERAALWVGVAAASSALAGLVAIL